MQTKFMHKLYSLLLHIPIYLDVMRCFNHDLHLFMGISIDSLFWVITLQNSKYMFCVF
jgi:hypothetical protein